MYSASDARTSLRARCRIRTSPAQRLLTAPRGFSQPATSFIGSWRLGIPRTPLLAPRLVTPSHATRLDHSHALHTHSALVKDQNRTLDGTQLALHPPAARSPCRHQLALLPTRRPINRVASWILLKVQIRLCAENAPGPDPPRSRTTKNRPRVSLASRPCRAGVYRPYPIRCPVTCTPSPAPLPRA